MSVIDGLRELYEARRLDEAWAEFERLLVGDPTDAEVYLYGALTAWRMGRPRDGRTAVLRGDKLKLTGTIALRLRFISGVLAREAGDTVLALEEFDRCLDILAGCPDLASVFRGSILYNQALALQHVRGRLADSLSVYRMAIAEFRAQGMRDYLRQALQNAAWVATDLGDYGVALELLSEAGPLCETDEANWVQQVGLAHLHSRDGHPEIAAQFCETLLRAEGVSVATRSLAATVAAETLLSQGLLTEAAQTGALAVELALQTLDDRCLSAAKRVHTQAKQAQAGA